MGISKNGVLGLKHSAYSHLFLAHTNELKKRAKYAESAWPWLASLVWFVSALYTYLFDKNKVCQDVSCWKAIQDEQWHFKRGDSTKRDTDFYHEKYIFDALLQFFKECNIREAMTESFFAHNLIKSYTIVY